MWVIFGIISSLFLGIYDVLKKISLKDNAVLPVLFWGAFGSGAIFIAPTLLSIFSPESSSAWWYIPPTNFNGHLLILLKSVIVAASWILAYFALKHLPLTIVAPIRASGPIWTLIGALSIFGEQLSPLQWAGLCVSLVCYYLFSMAGNKEGINFFADKWVLFIFLATIIGTVSSLFDKYLIKNFDRLTVQAYFSIYMVFLLGLVVQFLWKPKKHFNTPFQWKWSILLIGVFLTVADFMYFYALSFPNSLISILSVIRRSSVVYAFIFGAFLFKEKNLRIKAYVLMGIIVGILLIVFGSR